MKIYKSKIDKNSNFSLKQLHNNINDCFNLILVNLVLNITLIFIYIFN